MPTGLLEPRLYRAAFIPALLALIVLAFSLQDRPAALTPEFAPPTFSGGRAATAARQLVSAHGARESGSKADADTAAIVAGRMAAAGLEVANYRFEAGTIRGKRELVNVVGVKPGPSDRRLLVVAPRDGLAGDRAAAGAAETGILLELLRVIESRAFRHTLVLASVSGGMDGGLGADELAGSIRGPVDAAIVVRNVAVNGARQPLLAEYGSRLRPDDRFIASAARVLGRELSGVTADRATLAQLVRLGFPAALGDQAVFPAHGLPAVAYSPGGEPVAEPDLDEVATIAASGRAVLRALTTFDGEFVPRAPAPANLEVGGKEFPGWALVLFIGALLMPLLVAAIDGWARARRWHQVSLRGLLMPPAAAGGIAVFYLLARAFDLVGIVHAPRLVPDPAAVSGGGLVVLGALLALLVAIAAVAAAAAVRQVTPKGGEAGFALWLVFSAVALFLVNPVAAAFLLPLLHLAIVGLLAEQRPSRAQTWVGFAIVLLPLAYVVAHYMDAFALSAGDVIRYFVLLSAGGYAGVAAVAATCLFTGSVLAAVAHLLWSAPAGARRGRVSTQLLK